jgi:hypothetical protein
MLRYLPLIYLNHNRDRIASYLSVQWNAYQIPYWRDLAFPIKLQHFDLLQKSGFIDRSLYLRPLNLRTLHSIGEAHHTSTRIDMPWLPVFCTRDQRMIPGQWPIKRELETHLSHNIFDRGNRPMP